MELYCVKNEMKPIAYILLSKKNGYALLKGYTHRIIKTVDESLLEQASELIIKKEETIKEKYISLNQNTRINKVLCGKILHIDGDKEYLQSCLKFYDTMNIYSWGIYIKEKEIENKIIDIIKDNKKSLITYKQEKALHTLACKSAIKANMKFSEMGTEKLVEDVLSLQDANTCPHGRPIAYKLKKSELDRQFDRIK